jgi:hypothetical protein
MSLENLYHLAKAQRRPFTMRTGVATEPPWPEIDAAAYHGLAGEVVGAIKPNTESDPVSILLQYLAAVGNMIGPGPHYLVEATQHPLRLFVVLVGTTSKGRKGTSLDRVRSIVQEVDPAWRSQVYSGLSSGEGLIWAVRDPIEATVKGKKEIVDPGVTDKRLFVVEPEFAAVLAVSRREGNTLSKVIRDAWDRGDLGTLTKNSPARSHGAHISIIGHSTEEELRRELDRVAMANGLANRFLFACVRRSQCLPFGGVLDAERICELGRLTGEVVREAKKLGRIGMTAEAREIWSSVYPSLSEEKPGLLGAIVGRAEAQVIRLALHFAVLDKKNAIEVPHLEAAAATWAYCESSTYRIFGDALGDPVADEILRAVDNAGTDGLTRTDISNALGRNRNADQIGRALDLLMRRGKVHMEKNAMNGGRRTEVWVSTGDVGR